MHSPTRMTPHPAVRRRPRDESSEDQDADSKPLQTIATGTLLVISDDEPAFVDLTLENAAVLHWKRGGGDISGDPTLPGTFASLAGVPDLTIVVDLESEAEREACARAIRKVLPDALLIMLADRRSEGAENTWIVERRSDACHLVQRELHRIETVRRVEALRAFAEGVSVLPIVLHPDPDPDALASAYGIRTLLQRPAPDTPIVTLDEITRPENRRMAELLDIDVTRVTLEELRKFDAVICTDMQPRTLAGAGAPRFAVIDHHPVEGGYEPVFADVRPRYGATSTIITEYLRAADPRAVTQRLATALLYGIKTDTDTLARGSAAADVAAYAFLLRHADATLLRKVERPAYSEHTARAYGNAIANLRIHKDLAIACLGELTVDRSHILPDVADFLLAIDEVTWSAAAALVEGRLVITLRHLGEEPGAGTLARMLAAHGGVGGGHATMARAVLRLEDAWEGIDRDPPGTAAERILAHISDLIDRLQH